MMKLSLAILIISLLGSILAEDRVSYDGYKVYSVLPKNQEQADNLKRWDNIYGVDFWEQVSRVKFQATRVMVSPLTEQPFVDFLASAGIQHKLIIENVERSFERERHEFEAAQIRVAKEKAEGRATIDFNHFWSVAEIESYMDQLVSTYGDICSIEVVGSSIQGHLIRAMKITTHGTIDGSRPIIFIEGGVHAREWIAYMYSVKLLHELIEHSYQNMDILSYVDIIIIPIVNPDGYTYSITTDRMWRKNRRINTNAACPGVDGNRNYGHMWQSGTNQCSEIYPGTGPFSEPEIQAVRSILDQYGTNIKLYASIHSFGNYVLYPWGYDFVNIDNWEQHHAVGVAYANALATHAGTQYTVGNAAMLLYTAFGASDDYVGIRGVPLAYTLELQGGGTTGFDLPATLIDRVVVESWLGFRQFGLYTATNNWN